MTNLAGDAYRSCKLLQQAVCICRHANGHICQVTFNRNKMSYAANISKGALWLPSHGCRINPGDLQKQKKYVVYLKMNCMSSHYSASYSVFLGEVEYFSRINFKFKIHVFFSFPNEPQKQQVFALGTVLSIEFAICLPCTCVEKGRSFHQKLGLSS